MYKYMFICTCTYDILLNPAGYNQGIKILATCIVKCCMGNIIASKGRSEGW